MNAHCKLRQSSETVQSPVVPSRDKVWVLRLLRESHIWDRVTFEGREGGSDVGDGEGEGGRDEELGSAQTLTQCMWTSALSIKVNV